MELAARLALSRPLLLDGATGTELERRGVASQLPLWSARALLEAPEQVRAIHGEYAAAGAEIITANTFRTQRRTLATAGLGERSGQLTTLAVELARAGANTSDMQCWVAGSASPLEDCYRPDLVPEDDALSREHGRHADHLARAGVDLILIESINSVREGVAAARAAAATGLPFFVSFISWRERRLLSGEAIEAAADAVAAYSPSALLVNCLPPSAVAPLLSLLGDAGPLSGIYANLGAPAEQPGAEREEECAPDAFAEQALTWLRAGARIVGGCCGTTPAHIGETSRRLRTR